MKRCRHAADVAAVGREFVAAARSAAARRQSDAVQKEATAYCNETLRSVNAHTYTVREVALSVQAFGSVSAQAPRFFDEMAVLTEKLADSFRMPYFIAASLWGFAKAADRGVSFPRLRSVTALLCERLLDDNVVSAFRWAPVDVSNIVWALATLRVRRDDVLRTLARRALQQDMQGRFAAEPLAVSNILWGYAVLRHLDKPLFSSLVRSFAAAPATEDAATATARAAEAKGDRRRTLRPPADRHLSMALWSVSRFPEAAKEIGSDLLVDMVRQRKLDDQRLISTILSALSALGHEAPMLNLNLFMSAGDHVGSMDARTVASMLRSCVQLGEQRSTLFQRLMRRLADDPALTGSMEVRDLSSVVTSLARARPHAPGTPKPAPAKAGAAIATVGLGAAGGAAEPKRHKVVSLLLGEKVGKGDGDAAAAEDEGGVRHTEPVAAAHAARAALQSLLTGRGGGGGGGGSGSGHAAAAPVASAQTEFLSKVTEGCGTEAAVVAAVARALNKQLGSSGGVGPGALAAFLWGFTSLTSVQPALLRAVFESFGSRANVRQLDQRQTCSLLWCFVQLRQHDLRATKALVAHAEAESVPSALWAVSKLSLEVDSGWLQATLDKLPAETNGLRTLKPVDVCNLMYAMSALRHRDAAVIRLVQQRVASDLQGRIPPEGARTLVTAASRLKCTLPGVAASQR